MPRRLALALSLAFTTVVTFSLVALGANAGFFSDAKKSATTQKAQAAAQRLPDDAAALQYLAAVAEHTARAANTNAPSTGPRVLTEYVYMYETPIAGTPRRTTTTQPQTQAPSNQSIPQADTSNNSDDNPRPTAARPTAQATQPAAGAPTAPAPTAPAAAVPSPTPQPAPSATQPPAQPTSTPQPAQPTSTPGPAQAACSSEFVARVTAKSAISGGNLVTWSNGIQARVLNSTPHASALQVGVWAHVHTTTSGGCAVTEIELDD